MISAKALIRPSISPLAFARAAGLLLASSALIPAAALAQGPLPTGGQVAAGHVQISTPNASTMNITQGSDRAIVNWQSFSVAEGHQVNVQQNSAQSVLLNRVTGNTTSTIAGQVNANGQVYLVNPNGIMITPTGSVNAAGFVASTLGIADERFMAGDIVVSGQGGHVNNAGRISIVQGGYAALIGGKVSNSGQIYAPLGRVGLGSGQRATLDLAGDGFLQVALPVAADGGIAMSGSITADGGAVVMASATALNAARNVVNLSGVVQARSVSGQNGKVTLTGSDISLTGATVDVSAQGAGDGGEIRMGGNYQGGGTLAHAQTLNVDAGSRLLADGAGAQGDGGTVILWSDEKTAFAGRISAKGAGQGIGGDAEVSSKGWLDYRGHADLTGSRFGTLLLDPYNITISADANSGQSGFTANADDSVINVETLTNALASANVTVLTGSAGSQAGNITVAAPIAWSANSVLTLDAAGGIFINANITATGQNAGLAFVHGAADYALNGAKVTLSGANSSFSVNGNAYTLIRDVNGLQAMGLSGLYALATDIDASVTTGWNLGEGFVPIGTNGTQFTGTFSGLGHSVNGLVINRPDRTDAGLFGYTGTGSIIRDVGMVGGSVTGRHITGFLIGQNSGSVSNAYATGSVDGMDYVGGLIGISYGSVTNAYAMGSVSGTEHVGGLIGITGNLGSVDNVYATGSVVGQGQFVGGLIGTAGQGGRVINAYATGSVVGQGYYVGGLIGQSSGSVTNAYATGSVVGRGYNVGGLIGLADYIGSVTNAYATGSVSGSEGVGGLIGLNFGNVTNTYATGKVSGFEKVGGLIGQSSGSVTNAYATGSVAGRGYNVGGLIGANYESVTNGYWDVDSTGQQNGFGANLGSSAPIAIRSPLGEAPSAFVQASYAGFDFANDWFMIDGSTRPFLRSEWSTTITNAHQLQLMAMNLGASYTLAHSIDASETGLFGTNPSGMWNGLGFAPIGTSNGSFTGAFSGMGHSVNGLVIYRPTQQNVGLFGLAGIDSIIRDVGMVGGSVTGGRYTGFLIGTTRGRVTSVYATGSVTGQESHVGGLIGYSPNYSSVVNAYATGNVVGEGNRVGGLIGDSDGIVANAYATGSVRGASEVGGLIGYSNSRGSVTNGYATGSVRGTSEVGGLIGKNLIGGSITNSYWDSYSSGTSTAFGFGGGQVTAVSSNPAHAGDSHYAYNPAAWAALDLDVNGGEQTAWRMYAGHTMPLLKAFLTQATLNVESNTFVYDGMSHGPSQYWLAGGLNQDQLFVGAGKINAGSYSGQSFFYSGQQGYDLVQGMAGDLTIIPRALTITAENKSRIYGNADPAFTYAIGGSGLVLGDVLTGELATDAGFTSNVGAYAITQGSLTAGGNYDIQFNPGTLTVTPRALTITANNVNRLYGDTNPALTYVIGGDGLVSGEMLTGELATAEGLTISVGSYAITQGSLTASSNYDVRFEAGELSVTQRILRITAENVNRLYGEANPALTYVIGGDGLVSGETLTGELANAADLTSGVGIYAIRQGSLAASDNYNIQFEEGALSVTPRILTITANNATRLYGEANPALTYVIGGDGLLSGETLTGGLATAADLTSNVGIYAIRQGSLTAGGNYNIQFEEGALSVTPRILTVTADNFSRFYGIPNPVLTYTLSGDGLIAGDRLTGEIGTSAKLWSAAGDYAIVQNSLAASTNYRINYVTGVLSILPRQPNSNGIASMVDRHNGVAGSPSWMRIDDDSDSGKALDALGRK